MLVNQISSSSTFFFKRIVPAVFLPVFGFVALGVLFDSFKTPDIGLGELVPMGLIVVFLFLFFKFTAFDLADGVWDYGDHLVVKKGKHLIEIPIDRFLEVDHSWFMTPPRVSVTMKRSTELGKKFVFIPSPFIDGIFSAPEIALELSVRVKRANQSPQTRTTSGPA